MVTDLDSGKIPLPPLEPLEKSLLRKGVDLCEFNEVLGAARKQGMQLVKGHVVTGQELSAYFESTGRGTLDKVVHEAHAHLKESGQISLPTCKARVIPQKLEKGAVLL